MTLSDKYFGWKDIFFDRFVHCCNEKSGQPQGSNIPLAKINFDNKTGYVEDGTINIAELLQYLWINNKVYRCEYAPIDISSALQTLIRLTENAKHMFEDQPGVYDMIPYRGFFLRDDFSSGKDYSLDLDKIVSGMGGWYGEDCGKDIKITQCLEIRKDKNTTPIKKSNCLTTVMKDNVISSLPPGRYPNAFDMKDKFRYLIPVEICRLQTLPDDYLDGIAPNTAMSLAGNGWTVDVIAHLLRSIERKQMNDIVKEFRKITDELMFGSSETGTNVTCDKHEQNEAIRKSQNS